MTELETAIVVPMLVLACLLGLASVALLVYTVYSIRVHNRMIEETDKDDEYFESFDDE